MDGTHAIALLAFISAFFASFFLFRVAYSAFERNRHDHRIVAVSGAEGLRGERMLRNGVQPLMGLAHRMVGWEPVGHFCMTLRSALESKGYRVTVESLCSVSIAGISVCFMGGALVGRGWEFGLAFVSCMVLAVWMWSKRVLEKREEEVREALPDALHSMKVGFSVGRSLPQIIGELSSGRGALAEAFGGADAVLKSGGSIDEALSVLDERASDPEVSFLVAALAIQHRTGSSMAHVIDSVQETVGDELELKRSLRTQTAQAKLSARIVTALPFVLLALFTLISPGFLTPFFASPTGVVLLAVALLMQGVGVLMVRRLLKVEI